MTSKWYNGASCGLSDVLWAPHFGLPMVKHTLRSLVPGYYQCDLDIGEMFLNFLLHEFLKQYSGVDVKDVRLKDLSDEEWGQQRLDDWERWARSWMGLRDSPYRSIQWLVRLKLRAYEKDSAFEPAWLEWVSLRPTVGYES